MKSSHTLTLMNYLSISSISFKCRKTLTLLSLIFYVVRTYGQLTLTAGSSTYSGTNITLTASATPGPTQTTWFRNGIPFDPLSTGSNTLNVDRPGVYYVTADLGGGTWGKSNEVVIDPDCSDPIVGNIINHTFSTTSISPGTIGGQFGSPANYYMIKITGSNVVPAGVIVNFSNMHIVMDACAAIRVDSGGSLTINNCIVSSCDEWKSIDVMDFGELVVLNSEIMDGQSVAIATNSFDEIKILYSNIGNMRNVAFVCGNKQAPPTVGTRLLQITNNNFGQFLLDADIGCTAYEYIIADALGNITPWYYDGGYNHLSIQGNIRTLQVYDNKFYNMKHNDAGFDNLQLSTVYNTGAASPPFHIQDNEFYNGGSKCIDIYKGQQYRIEENYFFSLNSTNSAVFQPALAAALGNTTPTHEEFGIYDFKSNDGNIFMSPFYYASNVFLNNEFWFFRNNGAGIFHCHYTPSPASPPPGWTPPVHDIVYNTFTECEHGIVFSDNEYPCSATSTNSNSTSIELNLGCNVFDSPFNDYGIVGVGNLIAQGTSTLSAGNKFYLGTLERALITDASSGSINYFRQLTREIPLTGTNTSIMLDGSTITSIGMNSSASSGASCPSLEPMKDNLSSVSSVLSEISLFPNPVENVLNLNLPVTFYGTININGMDGKCVINIQVNTFKNRINTTALKSGVYMVSLKDTQNRVVYKQKIIKI